MNKIKDVENYLTGGGMVCCLLQKRRQTGRRLYAGRRTVETDCC